MPVFADEAVKTWSAERTTPPAALSCKCAAVKRAGEGECERGRGEERESDRMRQREGREGKKREGRGSKAER
eukprot:6061536-Pleurochrysis_carterae.AAC.1